MAIFRFELYVYITDINTMASSHIDKRVYVILIQQNITDTKRNVKLKTLNKQTFEYESCGGRIKS